MDMMITMIRLPSNRTRATTLLRWQFACPCFVASYREPFIELVSNRFESLNRRRRGTDPSGTNCSNLDRDRVMDAFEARFFLLFLSRFSPNSRSTRKSVVYILGRSPPLFDRSFSRINPIASSFYRELSLESSSDETRFSKNIEFLS